MFAIENTLHILLYSKNNENIQQSLLNITSNTLNQLEITSTPPITILNTLSQATFDSINLQYNFLLPTILGIYSKPIYYTLKTLLKKQTELFVISLSNNSFKWFYHEI